MREQSERVAVMAGHRPVSYGREWIGGVICAVLAVGAPWVAHLSGAPVRMILPMHWVVLWAGLAYGWRGGMLIGILSPGLSFLLSGMPGLGMILPLTSQLALYGLIAGLMSERLAGKGTLAVATALVAGQGAFVSLLYIFSGPMGMSFTRFAWTTLQPGLLSSVGQLLLLPWAVKKFRAS